MKVLVLLVRCYPRAFRERFEAEMIETLANTASTREALGLLRGLAAAWSEEIDWAPRLGGVLAAFALHLIAYTVLVPIPWR
jgi:hypothetical protein